MTMSIAEFLRILADARRVSAARFAQLMIEEWLWDNFAFDDIGAIQINPIMAESYAATEKIDLKLYRLFHATVLQ